MRIPVYGAEVPGGNPAADLFCAHKNVTLPAGGQWAETIQTKGLIIHNSFPPKTAVSHIPVITELKKDDMM